MWLTENAYMNPDEYTEEQRRDIEARTEKAKTILAELKLRPACMPQLVNLGDDVFATKLFSYLQDEKFSPTISPIQDV